MIMTSARSRGLRMQSDFVELLRRKETEYRNAVTHLQQEQAKIANQLAEASGMLEHIRALLQAELGESYENAAGQLGQRLPLGQQDLAGMTVNEAIRRVLVEAGHPMHADAILESAQRRGLKVSARDPKATIVTALVRGMQRGRYVRTGPNTFGLRTQVKSAPSAQIDISEEVKAVLA
jgi:HB1, ASXL, restriction endonuclease HTH domain